MMYRLRSLNLPHADRPARKCIRDPALPYDRGASTRVATRECVCAALKKGYLGNSDLEVTNACIGTMMMGSTNTAEEAWAQLDYYRSVGGNFIDTAETYPVPGNPDWQGETEKLIGRWLKDRGCREQFVVATKICGRPPVAWGDRSHIYKNRFDPPMQEPVGPVCLDRHNISAAITSSMRRLQVDQIDLAQLHWPDRYVPLFGKYRYDPSNVLWEPVPFEEMVETIGKELQRGRIRHWGLSNETTYGVTRMCETAKRLGVPLPVSLQNDFSICDRAFETELAEACHAYGIKLLSYGSLNGGFLSGKYLDGVRPEGARHSKTPTFQHRYAGPEVHKALKKYKALADSKGLSLTQMVIAWVASRWHVGAVVTGATSVSQLEEYISAFDVELDDETLDGIDSIHRKHRNPNWSD